MSYDPNHPQGGPAAAQPNMNMSFNQMLQRSQQEQRHQEGPMEAPGHPQQAIGTIASLHKARRAFH